jgi:multimeric flavodoxin WrbA
MKILAFNGSPRRNGNTSTLVQAILEGARDVGADTRHVVLDELDLKGCQGCLTCRQNPGVCRREDGLSPYLEALPSTDAVVVGCPVYMYHVSGQMKLLVDRLYSFYVHLPDGGYTSALPSGKRLAVVTSQGHPDGARFERTLRWLRGMVGGLGMELVGEITHVDSHDRPAIRDPHLLARAREIGRQLAVGTSAAADGSDSKSA